MIKTTAIENFGPIRNLDWSNLGQINLLIGSNATGKTFLLKALYTLIRTCEEFGRGDDPRKFDNVLADKLYWTYQIDKLGELVNRGSEGRLKVSMTTSFGSGEYSFGEKTISTITEARNNFGKREANSIFIPAKEVLSLLRIISNSRDQMKTFGFDDTYYDLAKALNIPTQKGRNYRRFANAREALENIVQGRVNFDPTSDRWTLQRGRFVYPINLASEGIKKIAILDNLLGNRYLTPESIVFIDEPESALHPEALSKFLDILAILAEEGIQIFLASHSYFAIKKLLLLSQKMKTSIPVLSFTEEGIRIDDMKNGMPENSIIQESIRLYKEEIKVSLE